MQTHMRRLAVIALPFAIVLGLTIWRAQGPAPRDAQAPAGQFSAGRAHELLRGLVGEDVPHPIGTAANRLVRDRVVAQFRRLGYETTVQRRFACNWAARCATVENVLARPAGSRPAAAGNVVLLLSHYDSVPSGPGTSDDAMGTAALLEIARILRGQSTRNPVWFLVTDGEEAGLLGAEAFAADAALMKQIGIVVNVENRGTFGASNMFETSTGNRWILRQLAQALPRPQATSFFYAIYALLPNDTDVTIFKRDGKAAVNFAAIRGVNWYHTPLDDLAHASPRTLQHHGENLLATARAFADADLDARSPTDATYFDVLGFFLVWWPQQWTLWIAVISLLLLVAAARRTAPREMTFGVLTAFLAILFAIGGGFLLSWLARLRADDMNWAAYPLPAIAAMWLAGLGAALLAAALLRRRSEPLAMLYGIAIVWHAIGIALALTLGGAAFLFVVPAAVVTLCALVCASDVTTSAIASTVAAVLILPLAFTLYDALGGRLMFAAALLLGILATLIAPLFAQKRAALGVIALALAAALTAAMLPPASDARPARLNLYYTDDPASPQPQWIADDVTPAMSKVVTFRSAALPHAPWISGTSLTANAPALSLPRPLVTQEPVAGGVRVRVRTQREANRLTLIFRGGTVRTVNGIALPPRPARSRRRESEWKFVTVDATPEIVVEIETRGLQDLIASDATFGLPPAGSALQQARDASQARVSHDGDMTVVRTRLK